MNNSDTIQSVTLHSVADMDAFMSGTYAPVRSTGRSDSFLAEVRLHRGADIVVGFVKSDAHVVERTKSLIGDSAQDYVNVGILSHGSGVLRQFDREVVTETGSIVVSDPDVPYAWDFRGESELIFFLFPRRMIGLSSRRLHALAARPLGISEELRELVVGFVRALESNLTEYVPRSATRLLRNAIELFATVVDEAAASAAGAQEGADRDVPLTEQARAYIDVNLGDARLTPQVVADALFISTRHLHGVFESEGTTVAQYIRQRRIDRCRRDLVDRDLSGLSVSDIGARWGFEDASHFSRTFRREEGMPPSAYRGKHTNARGDTVE